MDQLLHILVVGIAPALYVAHVSLIESKVSGRLALRHKARMDREREVRLRIAWQTQGAKQATKLAEWRRTRPQEKVSR